MYTYPIKLSHIYLGIYDICLRVQFFFFFTEKKKINKVFQTLWKAAWG